MRMNGTRSQAPRPSAPERQGETGGTGGHRRDRSSGHGLENAFARDFLRRLDSAEEPESAPEADLAGPWVVQPASQRDLAAWREPELQLELPHLGRDRTSAAARWSAGEPRDATDAPDSNNATHSTDANNAPDSNSADDSNSANNPNSAAGASSAYDPAPLDGFAVVRRWESIERGDPPYVFFRRRETALLAAAVLPGTGRDPCFRLLPDQGPTGFAIESNGLPSGYVGEFDENLVCALHVAASLIRSPESLAYLLEAAGHLALRQAGKILARRVPEADESGE